MNGTAQDRKYNSGWTGNISEWNSIRTVSISEWNSGWTGNISKWNSGWTGNNGEWNSGCINCLVGQVRGTRSHRKSGREERRAWAQGTDREDRGA